MDDQRTYWLEELFGWNKILVIFWSTFSPKRFFVFESFWNEGMGTSSAFKLAKKMRRKDIKCQYKQKRKL